jgi:hypothetical protein
MTAEIKTLPTISSRLIIDGDGTDQTHCQNCQIVTQKKCQSIPMVISTHQLAMKHHVINLVHSNSKLIVLILIDDCPSKKKHKKPKNQSHN